MITVVMSVFSITAHSADGDDIFDLPRYKIIDNKSVNMSTNRVFNSFTDVSIGGAMGLSHSVNNALYKTVTSSYIGAIKRTWDLDRGNYRIDINGYVNAIFDDNYQPIDDLANTLDYVQGTGYILALRDGTEITFSSDTRLKDLPKDNQNEQRISILQKIVKPNGFTIYVEGGLRTNTGYQIRNESESDSTATTSLYLEKYRIAINNAVEYCAPTLVNCDLVNDWPTSTTKLTSLGGDYTEYNVATTDALGRTNIHHYKKSSNTDGLFFVSAITDFTGVTTDYTYRPYVVGQYPPVTKVELTSAKRGNDTTIYCITCVTTTNNNSTVVTAEGYQAIDYVNSQHTNTGGPTTVRAWDKDVELEAARRYTMKKVTNHLGGTEVTFGYDLRDNLTFRHQNKIGESATLSEQAYYPLDCDIPSINPKTCNKPLWTKDAMGKQTDYTYHFESGQVATVTLPANEHNIRPQTRYSYTQKAAKYKINSDVKTNSPDKIWLLRTKKSCINSNYNGTACEKNDQVTTTYDYSSSNLLLESKQVSGKVDNILTTLRTCYRYDIYSNKIGETKPKAFYGRYVPYCPAQGF
jgi:hypothetical protein